MFIVAPIICGGSGFGPCFATQYLVSVLVLQSSRLGIKRESWLLNFNLVLAVMYSCWCSVALPRGALGRYLVSDCAISWFSLFIIL